MLLKMAVNDTITVGWYKVYLLAYFRSVIGCHRSRCGLWNVPVLISVLTAAKWVVSQSGTKSFTRWSRNVLMSTAGPRPTSRIASLPSAYLASHDISETARLPYMGCRGGAVLMACLPNKQTSDW